MQLALRPSDVQKGHKKIGKKFMSLRGSEGRELTELCAGIVSRRVNIIFVLLYLRRMLGAGGIK